MGFDGWKPKVTITLPETLKESSRKAGQVLETIMQPAVAKKIDILSDQLIKISQVIQQSSMFEKMDDIKGFVSQTMEKILSGADIMNAFELGCDVVLLIESVYKICKEELTVFSVFRLIYTIYKLIKMLIMRLPPFIFKTLFGEFKLEEEEEYFDASAAFTEGGDALMNLGYTALMSLLPKKITMILDNFQKYTRVKILEDIHWMTDIPLVLFSIPTYIISRIDEVCGMIPALENARPVLSCVKEQIDAVLFQIPEISTGFWQRNLSERLRLIREDRTILADVVQIEAIADDIKQVEILIDSLRGRALPVPNGLTAMLTDLKNYLQSSLIAVQEPRVEPVAIVLHSRPGVGKTMFINQVRGYLTKERKNTIYDYTPTTGTNDFHDQYKNQNVWIHEDIGQRGVQDWAQYITHISCAPSRMDGAALPTKGTLFFHSQVILGTSNINLRMQNLQPVKNCGWSDAEAIYRRWIVVEFDASNRCPAYKYDMVQHRYREVGHVDCSSPAAFSDALFKLYAHNCGIFERIKQAYSGVGEFRSFSEVQPQMRDSIQQVFAEAEGRKVLTQLGDKPIEEKVAHVDHKIETVSERKQLVYMLDRYVYMDINDLEQRRILDRGYFINGGSDIVTEGDVVVTDSLKAWSYWVMEKFDDNTSNIARRVHSSLEDLKEILASIPKEYYIGAGLITLLSGIMGIAMKWMFSSRKPKKEIEIPKYQPFVYWARAAKKTSASQLYARSEGFELNLLFQQVPSEAVKSIQRNVLKATFSYGVVCTYGYVIMIDHDHGITTAHLLLEQRDAPSEVFVRGFDSNGIERLATFMKVVSIDYAEDIAYLKYKTPHFHYFRSLAKSMKKEPSNKHAYILATEGVLSIGVPQECEVSSGVYRNTHHIFKAPNILYHNYDGVAQSSAGLCGALAVTQDGYILGWHVAGLQNGRGYVRFWDNKIRDYVLGREDSEVVPMKEETPIKGATIVDTDEYHHVHLKSAITKSQMYDEMMKDPNLSNNGEPYRAPAVLGGKDPNTGERTYQRSREKNLVPVSSPVNIDALEFAKTYVTRLVKKYTKGILKPLTEAEVVKGLKEDGDSLQINRMNKDASAGVTFGGTVGQWLDFDKGEYHPDVRKVVDKLERNAKKGVKQLKDVIFKDCNKDEIRNADKVNKPRCFSAGPLEYTILLRKWFGQLQAQLMESRLQHGIMIGVNATSREWNALWNRLTLFSKHFDGDYGMWDGGMRREFQEMLNDVLSSISSDPELTLTLLTHLCETVHVGMDMTYITTHSVPSGHGLTALYNSLINKMYVAYSWFLLVGRGMKLSSLALCIKLDEQLYAPVYGDDIIVAVHNSIADKFNAITFTMVMKDLGLGFTSASKKEHTTKFCPLRDITFLKRHFYAHREIDQVTGPLDISVLKNMCAYIADDTHDKEITTQKMGMLQRELYLHPPEVYNQVWHSITEVYEKVWGIPYYGLPRTELYRLYTEGELRSDLFGIAESSPTLPSKRKTSRLLRWK